MRPSDTDPDARLHECQQCGDRIEGPDSRACDCGGTLRNIGRPRDL
jgi:hypothetical protein